jgi:hypothetical protein
MERFARYIAIRVNREKVITLLERVTLIGSALLSAVVLTALYVRDYS